MRETRWRTVPGPFPEFTQHHCRTDHILERLVVFRKPHVLMVKRHPSETSALPVIDGQGVLHQDCGLEVVGKHHE